MLESTLTSERQLPVSEMAEHLIGSEIIKIGAEISERKKKGQKIFNFTVGDFDPNIFPIPEELTAEILKAYKEHQTNYPDAAGLPELRKEVSSFLRVYQGVEYSSDEILISAGARPLIFGTYTTLLDHGDKVIVPLPSWNNNHYCHLLGAKAVYVNTDASNNFMPTAEQIRPHLKDATLLALCSPLNPTGTVFAKEQLEKICDLVLEENHRRTPEQKPLYVMYDQIYWVLTYGDREHYDPVSLRPEMRDYTVFIDGISKSLAATGVRVGWAFGPKRIMDKMKAILSHVGAWAPKAEQVATTRYLKNRPAFDKFISNFKREIEERLVRFHKGFKALKAEGFKVDCVEPMAAIYLTIQFDLKGMRTADGTVLNSQQAVTDYILDEAKVGVIPFFAFGASDESSWYRLSVGTCKKEEIDEVINSLRAALNKLN